MKEKFEDEWSDAKKDKPTIQSAKLMVFMHRTVTKSLEMMLRIKAECTQGRRSRGTVMFIRCRRFVCSNGERHDQIATVCRREQAQPYPAGKATSAVGVSRSPGGGQPPRHRARRGNCIGTMH